MKNWRKSALWSIEHLNNASQLFCDRIQAQIGLRPRNPDTMPFQKAIMSGFFLCSGSGFSVNILAGGG
jgi:hypothetical protein